MGLCSSTHQSDIHPLPNSTAPQSLSTPANDRHVHHTNTNNNQINSLVTPLQTDKQQSTAPIQPTIPHINYTPQTSSERTLYKYYCPICMNYYTEIYSTSCCAHYTCVLCTLAHVNQRTNSKHRHTSIPPQYLNIPCIHCTTQPVQFTKVKPDAPIRHYSESPGTRDAWNAANRMKSLQATNSTLVSINEYSDNNPPANKQQLINYLSQSQYHTTLSPRLSIDTSENNDTAPDIQLQASDLPSPINLNQGVARLNFESYTDSQRQINQTNTKHNIYNDSVTPHGNAPAHINTLPITSAVPLPNTALPASSSHSHPVSSIPHTFIQHHSNSVVTLEPYRNRASESINKHQIPAARTRGSESTSTSRGILHHDQADNHSTDENNTSRVNESNDSIRIVNVDNGHTTYDIIKPMTTSYTGIQSISTHQVTA